MVHASEELRRPFLDDRDSPADEFHRIGVGQLRGCCALQQLESRCGFRGAQPAVGVVGCSLRTMPLLSMIFLPAILIPTLWLNHTSEASVLVADTTMSRMVELNADAPFCALYTDRGVIQKMVLGADPKKVRQMSSNLVADLEETCRASRDKGKNQPAGGGLMYPGTKWCGPGTLAKSYDDLGHHAAEDACCREHDHCPITILPRECINGICNNSPFTRSHCDCDAKFRRCLQNLNSEVANTLGALFFNVIQVTCFKERRPCSQWQRNGYAESVSNRLCSQYKFRPSDKYVPLMPLNVN